MSYPNVHTQTQLLLNLYKRSPKLHVVKGFFGLTNVLPYMLTSESDPT